MPNALMRARFHNRRDLRGLQKVTVRQKFANHSLAFLDYRIEDRHDYLLPPENTPVEVAYGVGPTGVRTHYGYVNHYESATDDHGRALVRMVLLGTSKSMNAMHPSSWQSTTRSSIARDIAMRHRMRSVIHPHPYVVENWATGTRTDYQTLKALAEECGYRLWVDGSTLHFLDPTRAVRSADSMTTPWIRKHQVQSVEVLGGSNIPGEVEASRRRVQFGLDYRTNEFFEATSGDATNPVEVIGSTATTFSEAQQIADAAERKQQDHYVLKASVEGDARLHPGSLLRMESGRVNNDQGGLWLASETLHEITNTRYVTRIVAARGVDQQPMSRVPSTVRGASGLAQAVVRDGRTWEAALQEHLDG